jgi:hypothetical protein
LLLPVLLFKLRRHPPRLALVIVAAALGNFAFGSATLAESFDKPLRKTVVDVGRSPYLMPGTTSLRAAESRIKLLCFYYANFMVKELDDPGLKGTRWVTVAPVVNGHAPACHRSYSSTDRFVAKEWWSFTGVKGSLLFLQAADGDSNGGMPFRVLD